MDFNQLSLRLEANRLQPFVGLLLWTEKAAPSPLDMSRPAPSTKPLCIAHLLAKSHPSWLAYLRGSCISYARAGMPKGLCEQAAARDAIKLLQALRSARNE